MDESPLDHGQTDLEPNESGSTDPQSPGPGDTVTDPLDPLGPPDPLPQPPLEFDPADLPAGREQRPGELTTGWRIVFAIGWAGVILGLAAVWKSSRTLGLPLWWLGPEADPRILPMQLLPFVPPALLIAGAVRSVRHLPWLGLASGAALVVVALPDLSRFPGLASVEIALGVAGALVSVASFAGVLLRAD